MAQFALARARGDLLGAVEARPRGARREV